MNSLKKQKIIFYCMILFSAILIFIFNIFTPMMTDDLFYAKEVSQAGSLWGLIRQEFHQYMTWTGRSICHLILRCFLTMDKMVFNFANTLVFILLTLLIYWNIERRKKYDIRLYLLINLFLWLFGVVFRQTVLWETGACNYLWGTTIILSFVTVYHFGLKRVESIKHPKLWTVGMPILGLLAGWCNENTSGGGILIVLIFLAFYLYGNNNRGSGARHQIGLKIWMITGLAGQAAGFLIMILAPGNQGRRQVQEEEHTGLLAIASRFQKITLAVRDNFLPLLLIGLILFIILYYQKKDWRVICRDYKNGIIWSIVFIAICYALIMTPEPMPRAYFGAGIFLIIAVVQFFTDVSEQETVFAVFKTGMVALLLTIMAFTYIDSGANLARIFREYREREVYLTQKAAEGVEEVTVPMLRPDFETKYSDGYNSDISENPGYWVNVAYESYYGISRISGVPREGWTEY